MNVINTVAIFCGSSSGNKEKYYDDAYQLGLFLAEKNIEIVYGGAKVGLMGAVASGALTAGGKVVGVMPDFIKSKEIAYENLTELITVSTMHERKMIVFERSDAAIVLPGGFGTMDEIFELLTWGQLGLHKKPIGILNTLGFYDLLLSFMDHMVTQNLLRSGNRDMIMIGDVPSDLLHDMVHYKAPKKPKWIDLDQI